MVYFILDMASQKKLKSYAAVIQSGLDFCRSDGFEQASGGEIKVRLTSIKLAWESYNEE